MPTVVATAAASNANAYDTVANADTYFDERLNVAAWTGASADDKARAIISGARWLDRQEYDGERATDGQSMKWPRIGAYDEDGYEYDSDSVPTCIKHANFEAALDILNGGTTDRFARTGLEQFENIKVGSLDITPAQDSKGETGALPEPIRALINHVLRNTRGSMRTELA